MSEVSANFVCGRVNDAADFSSVGLSVASYYQDSPDKQTSCSISSLDNKFCCDLEAIQGVAWKTGKTVSAEVFDPDTGYAAGPVSLVTSAEGFNVFPEMNLEKVIKVYSINSSVYFNISSLFINLSTSTGYNNINYSLNHSGVFYSAEVCRNCNSAEFFLSNLSYGLYELEITAYGKRETRERLTFSILKYLNFERKFECTGCKKNKVPAGAKVNMSITLDASHDVSGFLEDYFPSDWIADDSEGYSETHNLMRWRVEGKGITVSYNLTSPNSFIPRKYSFQSEFEGVKSSESVVHVSKFPFIFYIPANKDFRSRFANLTYHKISPGSPLKIKFNETLDVLAIFPKKEFKRAFAEVDFKGEEFEISSSLANREIDKILVRFKVEKNSSVEGVSDSKTGKIFKADKYKEEGGYDYYETYLDKKGVFGIIRK
jgi:hypothetical protein